MNIAVDAQRTSRELPELIPFNNLLLQWLEIKSAALPEINLLLESGAFCLGPMVDEFERSVAEYLGTRHAVGVNSGTSALHLALIVAGIGPGDKVLIPSMTFIATACAVLYVGATPVLCDVDAASATIDVDDAERRVDANVKAIIPVHLYGQPANMRAVTEFAARHGLAVIEDTAQAIGARYGERHAGTIARLGCYSFYPGKNLGAAGEAGLVVTDDGDMARRLRALRNHAQSQRYIHDELGFNYRMEGMQGLVLRHKLALLDKWTQERRKLAARYSEQLADLPIVAPKTVNGDHVFHLYVVRSPERDRLREHLQRLRIETGLHYPVPLHGQPCLKHLNANPQEYPVAQAIADECLSLPLFTGMTESQVDRVCEAVRDFFAPGKANQLGCL